MSKPDSKGTILNTKGAGELHRIMGNPETEKLTMTLTRHSIEWLSSKYPDAQSTQEGVRMALSDARQHHAGIENYRDSTAKGIRDGEEEDEE